jgi:uncharacterized protein (UPF0264 family)
MTIPRLLVSVRDAAEAKAAFAGGADLIDVKEPSRGALGRADGDVIVAVVRAVAGRVPVSAALGELTDPLTAATVLVADGLSYAKWGLAGLLGRRDWGDDLREARDLLHAQLPDCQTVAVAYADWLRAAAPRPAEVVALASRHGFPVLIDTWAKDGSTLLDYLSVDQVTAVVQTCHAGGVRVALAGSLGPSEIERLRGAAPDWFAVRGAACVGGRDGSVEENRVRQLAALVRG